jgi:N-acetylmuramoyl-L-alanine amidase
VANSRKQRLSPAQRSALAERAGADLFLSIHHDSVQPLYLSEWQYGGKKRFYCDRFTGYSIFVSADSKAYAASQKIAAMLGHALRGAGFSPTLHHSEPIHGENKPLVDREKGIYRYDHLAILRTVRIPVVLIECGVIVNRKEEELLLDTVRRDKMASAIAEGIREYVALQNLSSRSSFRSPGGTPVTKQR